jgi:hypothetical protein
MNFMPHVLTYSPAMGVSICRYCGLAEEYLRDGSLNGGWPYGGRVRNRDGIWVMQCRWWPALAENFEEIEEKLLEQIGKRHDQSIPEADRRSPAAS